MGVGSHWDGNWLPVFFFFNITTVFTLPSNRGNALLQQNPSKCVSVFVDIYQNGVKSCFQLSCFGLFQGILPVCVETPAYPCTGSVWESSSPLGASCDSAASPATFWKALLNEAALPTGPGWASSPSATVRKIKPGWLWRTWVINHRAEGRPRFQKQYANTSDRELFHRSLILLANSPATKLCAESEREI